MFIWQDNDSTEEMTGIEPCASRSIWGIEVIYHSPYFCMSLEMTDRIRHLTSLAFNGLQYLCVYLQLVD